MDLRAKNKAADCLSQLVDPTIMTATTVNMLTAAFTDRPAFNTRSCTQKTSPDATLTPHPDVSSQISQEATQTPKLLTADRLDALVQMQRTDPFCKHISKCLLNGKAPQHKFDTFYSCKRVTVQAHCNDCHVLYDDKCLDYVSMSTFIDSVNKCVLITSACVSTLCECLLLLGGNWPISASTGVC